MARAELVELDIALFSPGLVDVFDEELTSAPGAGGTLKIELERLIPWPHAALELDLGREIINVNQQISLELMDHRVELTDYSGLLPHRPMFVDIVRQILELLGSHQQEISHFGMSALCAIRDLEEKDGDAGLEALARLSSPPAEYDPTQASAWHIRRVDLDSGSLFADHAFLSMLAEDSSDKDNALRLSVGAVFSRAPDPDTFEEDLHDFGQFARSVYSSAFE